MPAPHTYDEITRRTVPDPDSSFRPPLPPEASATIGLRDRVIDALEANGLFDIAFELDGTRVIVRGEVRDAATRDRIEHVIAAIDGMQVESKIHVT
jgi:hypothetical protein